MARDLGFPVYDSDNHMYETEDAFTRHLPADYKGAIRYVQVDGRTKIAINGLISEYIPNPTFEVVAPPGAQEEYYRHGNPEGKSLREIFGKPIRCPDWARNAEARLPHLDELGIQGSLMFPTLASLLEERMRDDPDLTHVVVHSLNEWIYDEWTFNYHDRIFATPIITLPIVEKAIEELEWCLERGARCILIRPAPAWGLRGPRSPGLEEFDPFWARVQEAGVLVGMHSSDSGYADLASIWEGKTEFLPFKPNPLRLLVMQNRAISDMMTAMICHGAFTRFPDLRIATIENGGTWVKPLLEKLEGVYKKLPQDFPEHPLDAFRRNVYVNPFWEDGLEGLIDVMSPDRILFGSDYPHPEGLGDPVSFYDDLPSSLSSDDAAKIMGGNLKELLAV
ncbi:MAG: amidohydrolase family protein [Acidimicrobiaceae bacterium]|nr:amidohydrolase family protein [Acidimicrobiaceae bacterium]MDE0517546.1 amidohydrolase family protein [Acidimicrobiaceae bacterium]